MIPYQVGESSSVVPTQSFFLSRLRTTSFLLLFSHSVSPSTLAIMVSVPLLENLQFVTIPLNWEGVGLHICSGGTP